MYVIPNVNGTYQVGSAEVIVTDEDITIRPISQAVVEYEPQPVARRTRGGEKVVRIQRQVRPARQVVQPQENTQDKLAKSILKTTKFMNDFLLGGDGK